MGWERDVANLLIRYTALVDVRRGEELCISYGGKLWFEDADREELDAVKREEKEEDDWLAFMSRAAGFSG